MNIVPVGQRDKGIKRFALLAATAGSTSYAAPGTGYAYMPIGAWVTASAVGSFTYFNGTSGTALFSVKAAAGGVSWLDFWEEPSNVSSNKCPVLEAGTSGVGVHGFHVFAIVVRSGAGAGALEQ